MLTHTAQPGLCWPRGAVVVAGHRPCPPGTQGGRPGQQPSDGGHPPRAASKQGPVGDDAWDPEVTAGAQAPGPQPVLCSAGGEGGMAVGTWAGELGQGGLLGW